ncbi:MAG: hypothetical protein JJ958_09320 [Balneola sp.]|nr:hypothetical protein [Balneola sp.]
MNIDFEPDIVIEDDFAIVDLVEILCLTNLDNSITRSDFLNRYLKLKERKSVSEKNTSGSKEHSEISDNDFTYSEDIFNQLEYRIRLYEDYYPFNYDESNERLTVKERSVKGDLYIFFLLCVYHNCFDDSTDRKLDGKFEEISKIVLESYLSKNAEIHLFGKNSTHGGKFTQINKLKERIVALAESLDEEPILKRIDGLKETDTGDGGVDIVAWLPFEDGNYPVPVFLCQCTIGKDWIRGKHLESSVINFNYIAFTGIPYSMLCIPHLFRNSENKWYSDYRMGSFILIDRHRSMSLLKNLDKIKVEYKEFVDFIVDYSEKPIG